MTSNAASVVQAQVDAYNRRSLDDFLSHYSPDVRIEDGHGHVMMSGLDAVRTFYDQLFSQSPNLQCEIKSRIEVGDFVVDEEVVTGVKLEGYPTDIHAAVIYHVDDSRIVEVRLLM